MCSFYTQSMRQFDFLACPALEGERADGFRRLKVDRHSALLRRVAQQASLQCGQQLSQPNDIDGKTVGGSAASSSDRPTAKNQLRRKARDLGLPGGLFVASQIGHLGQMFTQARIPGFKLRKQFLPDAVPRESEIAIRRVFAPGLLAFTQPRFDLRASRAQERAQNLAFMPFEDGMDRRKSFSPGSAEEFGHDSFSLVVESMSSRYRVYQCMGLSFG
jgi:hypothetical protein